MKRRGHYTYTLPIWLSTDNLESLLSIRDDGMLRVTEARVRRTRVLIKLMGLDIAQPKIRAMNNEAPCTGMGNA
jgi:hypothetical protein